MSTSPEPGPLATPSSAGPHTVSLVLTGDLDYDTCDELLQRVHSALDGREDVGDLRLDCRELGAVDSMGLSTLLQIHRSAGHDGIGFHLDDVGPALRRLLEITGTYTYLTTPGQAGPTAESRHNPT
ncbi:STAS domain-containing protein [Streptomyces sp. NPDC085927]|uniref:STAS domain-containing protein n=1 Tax=Streptomyces sp. NPDC085927 TaxID=3365738 RepID=UPI0037D74099